MLRRASLRLASSAKAHGVLKPLLDTHLTDAENATAHQADYNFFVLPKGEQKARAAASIATAVRQDGPLPCSVAGSKAAQQALNADRLAMEAEARRSGRLPSPRSLARDVVQQQAPSPSAARGLEEGKKRVDQMMREQQQRGGAKAHAAPQAQQPAVAPTTATVQPPPLSPPSSSSLPRKLNLMRPEARVRLPPAEELAAMAAAGAAATGGGAAAGLETEEQRRVRDAAMRDYYATLPQEGEAGTLTKEQMWARISQTRVEAEQNKQHPLHNPILRPNNAHTTASSTDEVDPLQAPPQRMRSQPDETVGLQATDVDLMKMDRELLEQDRFHFRLGEHAFTGLPDSALVRRDYYSLCNLALHLNKARWGAIDVLSQRGQKTTGSAMKLQFWRESVGQIVESRGMMRGQFVDAHPVLRPFADAVSRHPTATKAFMRGFVDARLRVQQQPANLKQLFDHFDKSHGYLFNTQLEFLGIKDEHAEHAMQHIARAVGITQHCVMMWKHYARYNMTMLPADLCADYSLNMSLLRNVTLASKDRAMRHLLHHMMSVVKGELLHAQELAPIIPPTAWPLLMESVYPNYYLTFLARAKFDVSALWADHLVESPFFAWYVIKKRVVFQRGGHDVAQLLDEAAPIPYLKTSLFHRGSKVVKREA